jgi:hypothetical protein
MFFTFYLRYFVDIGEVKGIEELQKNKNLLAIGCLVKDSIPARKEKIIKEMSLLSSHEEEYGKSPSDFVYHCKEQCPFYSRVD